MKKSPQFRFGLVAIAAAALLTAAAPATSQQGNICAARDDLVNQLGQQFRESQKAVGTLSEKAIMEVFVSQAGTWTILATDTSGNSCIIAAGQDWDEADSPLVVGNEV